MKDAISILAEFSLFRDEALAELAIDLHVQLEQGTATRPVLWMLVRARERAAEALQGLSEVDATKTAQIIVLQGQVQFYREMVEDCRALMSRGKEADSLIDENERAEIADILEVEDARAMGLKPTPEDM